MKAFRYICAALIFSVAAFFGHKSIDALTTMYLHFAIIAFGCGLIVLLDGGRKRNAKSRKIS